MISIFTVLLVLIILFCIVVLFLFNRLAAKLNHAEEARRELEPLVRERLDLLYESIEKQEAYEGLKDLCEIYRDADAEAMLAAHEKVEEALEPFRAALADGSLPEIDEKIKNAATRYNEAADLFNREIAVFPGKLIAYMFALKPIVLFFRHTSSVPTS